MSENRVSLGLSHGTYQGRGRLAPLEPDEDHVHDEDQAEEEADDPRGENLPRQLRLVDARHVVDQQAPRHHIEQGAHSAVRYLLKGRHKRQ